MARTTIRSHVLQFVSNYQTALTGTILFAIAFSLFAGNAIFNQSGNHPMPIWKTNSEIVTHTVSKQDKEIPVHRVEVSRIEAIAVPVPEIRPRESRPSFDAKQGGVAILVQELLVQQGYYFGPVDGLIGTQTKLAIAEFQATIGVSQDGVITPTLLSQLERTKKPAVVPTPRTQNIQVANKSDTKQFDPAIITRIQIGLINFGVSDIAIDGVMGNQTRSAIEQFQKRYKLDITGLPSTALINKLVTVGALNAG